MKIRKANIIAQIGMIGDVYLHENKKNFIHLSPFPSWNGAQSSHMKKRKPLFMKGWKRHYGV